MKRIILQMKHSDEEISKISGLKLGDDYFDSLIDEDCDAFDSYGRLVFRFRKNAIPFDVIKLGYESFRKGIKSTNGRGAAAGRWQNKSTLKGKVSKYQTTPEADSGNAGFLDSRPGIGPTSYCRKTAFTKSYFDTFKAGIPFVEYVDKLYSELCPEHYAKQKAISSATNINFRIANTSFTTVTINRNFQTAVHKDVGDYPEGFGNLCVYTEGSYSGGYFVLPEFRIAINVACCDMLFVDVHRWHCNSTMKGKDFLRISFVMYYREYMFKCGSPKQELQKAKMNHGGFLRL